MLQFIEPQEPEAPVVPETTAAPETAAAEPVSTEAETAVAEQPDGETAPEGETTTKAAEAEEVTDKQPHQTTASERIQQLINERKASDAKLAELEAKFNAIQQPAEAKPDFYEVDMNALNAHVGNTLDQIDALRLEGRHIEALQLQDGLASLKTDLQQNEAKKAAWQEKQQTQQRMASRDAEIDAGIQKAAEFVRLQHNITPEAWKVAEDFFGNALKADPMLYAQYAELAVIRPVAALLFAKDYCEKHMKAPETAAQKEAAKATLAPSGSSSAPVQGKDISTMSDAEFEKLVNQKKFGIR